MKYEDWLYEWLETCIKGYLKERTYQKYKSIADSCLAPALGDFELDDLNACVLQEFISDQTKKYSSSTVNNIITPLRESLRRAVKMGLAQRQFSDNIIRPRNSERKVDCFTMEEQRKIEHYVKSGKTHWLGIIVCLYTGLRIGELMALAPSDVDLQNMKISVSKSCFDSWENGTYVKKIDSPKTPSSKRVIPVPRNLLPYLKRLKKECNGAYLISNKDKNISVRAYQRTFELILKHLGIPHKGFHSLRHTFATRALECGMDVKTLSEILGHRNVNVTLSRYAHSLDEHKIAMMNKLGRYLSPVSR